MTTSSIIIGLLVFASGVLVKIVVPFIVFLSLLPIVIALLAVVTAETPRAPIVSVSLACVGPIISGEVLVAEV